MDKLLSDSDVSKLGNGIKIITYPELNRVSDIDQLFSNTNKIAILYVTDEDQSNNTTTGHWVGLFRRNGEIEFFDPYGTFIDDQFKQIPDRASLGQPQNVLARLLLNAMDNGRIIHFNERKFQRSAPDVATCGRHVGLRGRFSEIPLKDYQKLMLDRTRGCGYSTDEIAVELSDHFLS